MTIQETKSYLSQAWWIDRHIQSKIEQQTSLRELAAKAVSTLSDMPRSPSPNLQPMENIIAKICDLEQEINGDIDALVDLKCEIMAVIKNVTDQEQQIILEKRYLGFITFERIAVDMNYSMRHTFRLHDEALESVSLLKHGS
ncbi:hypothetical protein FACS1894184_09310 [Clostridia bacterium]|nr:hypothetical protein FACS1894184_09310 [Clostridia bacterium]